MEPEPEPGPEPEGDPPRTLAALGAAVGASVAQMLKYSEADMGELLKEELGTKGWPATRLVARNAILEEWLGGLA